MVLNGLQISPFDGIRLRAGLYLIDFYWDIREFSQSPISCRMNPKIPGSAIWWLVETSMKLTRRNKMMVKCSGYGIQVLFIFLYWMSLHKSLVATEMIAIHQAPHKFWVRKCPWFSTGGALRFRGTLQDRRTTSTSFTMCGRLDPEHAFFIDLWDLMEREVGARRWSGHNPRHISYFQDPRDYWCWKKKRTEVLGRRLSHVPCQFGLFQHNTQTYPMCHVCLGFPNTETAAWLF